DRLGKTHATLGIGTEFLELALAATTSVDLALDHIKRARERLGSSASFVHRVNGDAFSDRRAVFLQQCLGLVFMNVHVWSPWGGYLGCGCGALPHRVIPAGTGNSIQAPGKVH